jgi:hypothetical protein
MPSEEVVHISPTEVTPELGKGALGTWRSTQPYGGRLDKTGTYAGPVRAIVLPDKFRNFEHLHPTICRC